MTRTIPRAGTAALIIATAACAFTACGDDPVVTDDAATAGADAATDAPSDVTDGALPRDSATEAKADAGVPSCSEDGWCQTAVPIPVEATKSPDANPFHMVGVWGDGTGVVWAVGNRIGIGDLARSSSIYRWDGSAWAVAATFSEMLLTGIAGKSPTAIYVSGQHLVRTTSPGFAEGDADGLGFATTFDHAVILRSSGASSATLTWTPSTVVLPGVITSGVLLGNMWGTGTTDPWLAGTSLGKTSRGFVARVVDAPDGAVSFVAEYLAPAVTSSENPTTRTRLLSRVWGSSDADVWAGGNDVPLPLVQDASWAGGITTPVLGISGPSTPLPAGVTLRRSVSDAGVASWSAVSSAPHFLGGFSIASHESIALGGSWEPLSFPQDPEILWTAYCESAIFVSSVSAAAPSALPTLPPCAMPRTGWGAKNDFWVAGDYGQVRHWDGAAWELAKTALPGSGPIPFGLNAVWVGKSEVWLVGDGATALVNQKLGNK